MFFVLTKRVIKFSNSGGQDRFAPRQNNVTSWHVNGPFTMRSTAERAALSALGTHTCVSAQVVDAEQLTKIVDTQNPEYHLREEANKAIRLFLAKSV